MRRLPGYWRARQARILIPLLLAVPLLATDWRGTQASLENRQLASLPDAPRSWEDALAWPRKVNAWLDDRLGLRAAMVEANTRLRYRLFGEFPSFHVAAGRNGRVFLASHVAEQPYMALRIPCGDASEKHDLAAELAYFGRALAARGIAAGLMIAPSASVVYPEDLPAWLAQRCARHLLPVEQALRTPGLGSSPRIHYTLEALRAGKAQGLVYPKTWFHWGGDGPRIASETSMAALWDFAPGSAPPLRTRMDMTVSDLQGMFPGLRFDSPVRTVDFEASGVQACNGPRCYPGMEDVMERLLGVHRFGNPQAPLPRLVILSDSFGFNLGPWYSRYYRDVLQIVTNGIERLDPAQRARLRDYLFKHDGEQRIVFVYHDNTLQAGRISYDFGLLFAGDGVDVPKPAAAR